MSLQYTITELLAIVDLSIMILKMANGVND